MKTFIAISTVIILVLAACGGGDVSGSAEETTATTAGSETTVGTGADGSDLPRATVPGRFDPAETPLTGGETVTGEVPADILDAIMSDANARFSGGQSEVLVAEAVVWNDGSLGCPEPDVLYTQALVNGYRVVVGTSDGNMDYRVGENGFFRLCEPTGDTPAGIGRIGGGDDGGEPTG